MTKPVENEPLTFRVITLEDFQRTVQVCPRLEINNKVTHVKSWHDRQAITNITQRLGDTAPGKICSSGDEIIIQVLRIHKQDENSN